MKTLESNHIKSGSRARKIWKYISRIVRLEKRGVRSWAVGKVICDTLDYLEELGVYYHDDYQDLIVGYYWDKVKKTRYEIQDIEL